MGRGTFTAAGSSMPGPLGGAVAVVTNITPTRFAELVSPLSGLPVAAVWLADYTALYVELGTVVDAYESGRPRAEYSVYLGFDWVFEPEHGSALASNERDAKARIADLLAHQSVASVAATRARELELRFDSGDRIRSADRDADPDWSIHLPQGRCVAAESGSLVIETDPTPVIARRPTSGCS
jgi:hypothetical protein